MAGGLLAACGIIVSHATARQRALSFGQGFASQTRRKLPAAGDKRHMDGVALTIHPRTLRHSCGPALAGRGCDLRLIQDPLGHRDPRRTVHCTRTAGRRFEGLRQ